jgi:hypothetical protein
VPSFRRVSEEFQKSFIFLYILTMGSTVSAARKHPVETAIIATVAVAAGLVLYEVSMQDLL